MFLVFRCTQLDFAFRITRNKTKLPGSLSEFQFVFTAVRGNYIIITSVKRTWGWCTRYVSRSLGYVNSSSWIMNSFLSLGEYLWLKHVAVRTQFVFIINGCIDCFILGI